MADWAEAHGAAILLLVRPGDHVFPGAPIALVRDPVEGVHRAIRNATAQSSARVSSDDIEFALRQLVEVAVRALSPGINDPHTAISVLDRFGVALCDMANKHLPCGVHERASRVVLVVPTVDYDGLVDGMFHMIRQNARASAAVLIRLLEVLTSVVSTERDERRGMALQRHAGLLLSEGARNIRTPGDLAVLRQRHAEFERMRRDGPTAVLLADAASARTSA